MTARANTPQSNAIMAKRADLTPKEKRKVRGANNGRGLDVVRSRGRDTSNAGYNDGASIAYRMVKMPNVLKLYHEEKAKYEAAGDMTRKMVMDMLLESYDMAKLMAEPASMVSAAREIGKMCGYYAPVESRVKVDVSGNVMLDRLNNLSDAELLKLISDGSAS